MARRITCAVLVAAVAAFAGCREERESVPSACLEGARTIRVALEAAPGDVSLRGTKLSDCFVKSSDTGDLTAFAGSMLDAATPLVVAAKRSPESPAALQLGYLRGALGRGALPGIHDELMRRLDQELLGVDKGAGAYRRGVAAGRDHG